MQDARTGNQRLHYAANNAQVILVVPPGPVHGCSQIGEVVFYHRGVTPFSRRIAREVGGAILSTGPSHTESWRVTCVGMLLACIEGFCMQYAGYMAKQCGKVYCGADRAVSDGAVQRSSVQGNIVPYCNGSTAYHINLSQKGTVL